jgi:hypothetical protein
MSMGTWFRTHRKQVITHTSIIVGFALFTIFVAEPLFERLEKVPGEAQLQPLQLPAETNDIRHNFDEVMISSHFVEIEGWAFIEGHDVDLERSRTYIVLKSDRHIYIFDTAPAEHPGVTKAFETSNLSLDWAGFATSIPLNKVASGEYILGNYITKDDIQALQYTDKLIVRSGDSAKLTLRMSEVQKIPLPSESGEIRVGLDTCEVMKDENEKEFTQIQGWAFIDGQSAEDSKIYVVLKSQTATYIFDTILQKRADITAAFVESGLNLDNSGFIARIPVDSVGEGAYTLGIYIKKGDIEALQYTDKLIVRSGDSAKVTLRMSEVQKIPLPSESGEIRVGVDTCEAVKDENEKEIMEIVGWAFIEGQSAEDGRVYVVLESETATYVFDTILEKRPDVTAYFQETGLNLDNSGFIARIRVDTVKQGTYELGIYIKKGDIEALQYIDRVVEF